MKRPRADTGFAPCHKINVLPLPAPCRPLSAAGAPLWLAGVKRCPQCTRLECQEASSDFGEPPTLRGRAGVRSTITAISTTMGWSRNDGGRYLSPAFRGRLGWFGSEASHQGEMGGMGEERLDHKQAAPPTSQQPQPHNQAAPHSNPPPVPYSQFRTTSRRGVPIALPSSGPQLCPQKGPKSPLPAPFISSLSPCPQPHSAAPHHFIST